jgi:hypothetical protein
VGVKVARVKRGGVRRKLRAGNRIAELSIKENRREKEEKKKERKRPLDSRHFPVGRNGCNRNQKQMMSQEIN